MSWVAKLFSAMDKLSVGSVDAVTDTSADARWSGSQRRKAAPRVPIANSAALRGFCSGPPECTAGFSR